jgi:hypothetical protein
MYEYIEPYGITLTTDDGRLATQTRLVCITSVVF